MKPLTPIGSPSPLRLLNKGPDYLRRQMDGGGRGGSVSAVERLEADKAKYVKSQQVINTKQEPVPVPCATPPPPPRRPFTLPATPDPAPRVCAWPDEHDDSRKENRQAEAKTNGVHSPRTPGGPALVAPHSAPMLRRSTGKRMLRPDSLLIYRQKKECKSPGGAEVKSYGFVRRLFQASVREKSDDKMAISEEKAPSRDGDSRMSWTNDRDTADTGAGSRTSSKTDSIPSPAGLSSAPQPAKDGCTNGTRSGGASAVANGNHSGPDDDDENDPWRRASPPPPPRRWSGDLRLRRSEAMSEQGRFFDFCGLDMDMIERLGRGNFLSAASSIDTLSLALRSISGGGCGGSEPSEFSRHSGDALFIEELDERLPTGVSIIERNARVIKWLYSCKNAAQEGPKESTV